MIDGDAVELDADPATSVTAAAARGIGPEEIGRLLLLSGVAVGAGLFQVLGALGALGAPRERGEGAGRGAAGRGADAGPTWGPRGMTPNVLNVE